MTEPMFSPLPCVSTAATRTHSGSSTTALQTSRPIRPYAPMTPTRITAKMLRDELREVPLARRPHDRKSPRVGAERFLSHSLHVLEGHRVDPDDHLVGGKDLAVAQLALAEPRHPAGRVLQPEHEAALQAP